ncbi:MAG: caspase family protein [Ardenticatenales bacterium]|nr:caspase family protein [Ardenticatenales bacterium]
METAFRPARALIVGINEYDAAHIADLRGCVGDATAVAAFLQAQYRMAESHIRLLTAPATPPTQKATRAAIISGFRDFLLKELKAGEEGLFYYSGHGSTTALDVAIGFGDARGETLVPADARTGEVLDLLDRELRCLIAELIDKGVRLTVILDSCHSAGATRTGNQSTREQPEPQAPVARLTGDGNARRRTLQTVLDGTVTLERLSEHYGKVFTGYTLLAGSLGTQLSYEIPRPGPDGKTEWRGAMTTALLEVLARAGGPMSYQELARAVRGRLPDHPQKENQYPELSGDHERQLFSKERLPRPLPLFSIQQVEENAIIFDGGSLDGIEVGSVLTAFTDWSLKQPRGQWTVTECWLRKARAVPVEANTEMLEPGQPLQLAALAKRPTLYFGPGAEKVREEWYKLFLSLSEQQAFRKAREEAPRTTIELFLRREVEGSPFLLETRELGDYNILQEGESWLAKTRDGKELEGLRYPLKEPYTVARLLNRIICYDLHQRKPSAIERLAIPIGTGEGMGLRLAAKALPWTRTEIPLTFGAAALPLRKNDRIEFTLHNRGTQALFVILYRLYPKEHALERLWPRDGTSQLVVDASSAFVWESRQEGVLHLQLLASSQPLDSQVWPCGQATVQRDFDVVKPVSSKREGWNVEWFTLGRVLG